MCILTEVKRCCYQCPVTHLYLHILTDVSTNQVADPPFGKITG